MGEFSGYYIQIINTNRYFKSYWGGNCKDLKDAHIYPKEEIISITNVNPVWFDKSKHKLIGVWNDIS